MGRADLLFVTSSKHLFPYFKVGPKEAVLGCPFYLRKKMRTLPYYYEWTPSVARLHDLERKMEERFDQMSQKPLAWNGTRHSGYVFTGGFSGRDFGPLVRACRRE